MGNMSYCRFENTFADLKECYQHMDDDLSDSEKEYKERIIKLCQHIIDAYSDDDDNEEE